MIKPTSVQYLYTWKKSDKRDGESEGTDSKQNSP